MPDRKPPGGFDHAGRVARAEIVTSAPPERVWQAWTDEDRVAEWFPDRARGVPRPGSAVTWYFDRFKVAIEYSVLVAEAPRQLVMKGSGPTGQAYVQEALLIPEGEGTRIHLASSGMSRDDEEHAGIVSGWQMSLAILKHYLESHFGEPRRSFFAMQPARFEYPQIRRFFTEEWHLGRWLTSTGSLPDVGQPYRLELRGGDTMSGSVLAVTSHEVALSWVEINGFLEMKAFRLGGPGQRAVCLRGSGWDMSHELRLETERMVNTFVGKLVHALEEPTRPRSGNGHGAVH